ncbi:hypothetical protein XENORESO_004462, partial [Xenotaenia resolanae]
RGCVFHHNTAQSGSDCWPWSSAAGINPLKNVLNWTTRKFRLSGPLKRCSAPVLTQNDELLAECAVRSPQK